MIEVRFGVIIIVDGVVNKPISPQHAIEVIQVYKQLEPQMDIEPFIKKLKSVVEALADDND